MSELLSPGTLKYFEDSKEFKRRSSVRLQTMYFRKHFGHQLGKQMVTCFRKCFRKRTKRNLINLIKLYITLISALRGMALAKFQRFGSVCIATCRSRPSWPSPIGAWWPRQRTLRAFKRVERWGRSGIPTRRERCFIGPDKQSPPF